jgi:hypothetical protein
LDSIASMFCCFVWRSEASYRSLYVDVKNLWHKLVTRPAVYVWCAFTFPVQRVCNRPQVMFEDLFYSRKEEDFLNAGREQSVTCGNIVPICTLILHLSRPIQGYSISVSRAWLPHIIISTETN